MKWFTSQDKDCLRECWIKMDCVHFCVSIYLFRILEWYFHKDEVIVVGEELDTPLDRERESSMMAKF